MKETPRGWPRLSVGMFYEDPATAIDWLCKAFGFDVRIKVEGEGGRIEHSELVYGDGLVMVGGAGPTAREGQTWRQSPKALEGANTQAVCIFVDDVDAHCERARAAGATIQVEPTTTDYGEEYWSDRTYQAIDLEGHRWWFMQRVRDPRS
ncbi:MAG: VOC family protein [Polyangiaceae bacterium]